MTLYYRREDRGDKPVCPVLTPVIDLIFHLNPGFSLGALPAPARRIVNPIMTGHEGHVSLPHLRHPSLIRRAGLNTV